MNERNEQPWSHYTPTHHIQTATGNTVINGKLYEFREYEGKKSKVKNVAYRLAAKPANNPFMAVAGGLQSQYSSPSQVNPGTSSVLSGNPAAFNSGIATGFTYEYDYSGGGAPGSNMPSVSGVTTNPNAVLVNQPANVNTVNPPTLTTTTAPTGNPNAVVVGQPANVNTVNPDAQVLTGTSLPGQSSKLSPVVIFAILAAAYLAL